MAEDFRTRVMLCWPSNRSEIATLNAQLPADQHFAPTVEHSLSSCDACRRGIWIGPQQKALANSPFLRARKLCMFCTGDVQRVLNLDPRVVDVNPDLRNARRRTA